MIRIIADTRSASQHWERRCDKLPYLMVPMSDGTVVRYNAEVAQPSFQMAMETIRSMNGYKNKGEENNETDL